MKSPAIMLAAIALLCCGAFPRLSHAAMGTGAISTPFSTDWTYASATFYDAPQDFKQARDAHHAFQRRTAVWELISSTLFC